jgi:hypothetical protein
VVGEFDPDFLEDLRVATVVKSGGEIVFFAASKTKDLDRVAKLAPSGNGALWVIYPKGVPAIREMEVLEAGRAAGLKDVKVASFSATHTGLKFVVPLAKR